MLLINPALTFYRISIRHFSKIGIWIQNLTLISEKYCDFWGDELCWKKFDISIFLIQICSTRLRFAKRVFYCIIMNMTKIFSVSRHNVYIWYSLTLYDQKFFVQFQFRNLCLNITLKTLYFFTSYVELQQYDTKTKFIIVFLFVSIRAWVNRNMKKKNWERDT